MPNVFLQRGRDRLLLRPMVASFDRLLNQLIIEREVRRHDQTSCSDAHIYTCLCVLRVMERVQPICKRATDQGVSRPRRIEWRRGGIEPPVQEQLVLSLLQA